MKWHFHLVKLISCTALISTISVLAPCADPPEQSDRTAVAIEALSRLKGIDLEANPAVKAAVLKVLDLIRGKPQFVELVRDFKIEDQDQALLEIALQNPNNAAGVDAARLILEHKHDTLFENSLNGTNTASAVKLAEVLGNAGENQIVPLLEPIVADTRRDATLRKQAVRSLAKNQEGASALLRLAKDDKLAPDLKFITSSELNHARWPGIKAKAAQLLPLPQGQNAQDLPPISELVKMKGDSVKGAEVFRRDTVACIKCHQVNGEGVDFGPALSEIGTKLGKDALYEAVLDPSAGIAFGYEAWQIELKNGDEGFGLIVSDTADEIAVKAQTGIVTRYKKNDIARKDQQKLSIMPTGLQQAMSTQELVDLVEYLSSLKKAPN